LKKPPVQKWDSAIEASKIVSGNAIRGKRIVKERLQKVLIEVVVVDVRLFVKLTEEVAGSFSPLVLPIDAQPALFLEKV
jgi:hypothetical protein